MTPIQVKQAIFINLVFGVRFGSLFPTTINFKLVNVYTTTLRSCQRKVGISLQPALFSSWPFLSLSLCTYLSGPRNKRSHLIKNFLNIVNSAGPFLLSQVRCCFVIKRERERERHKKQSLQQSGWSRWSRLKTFFSNS